MSSKWNVFFRLIDTVNEKIGRAISLIALPILLLISLEVVARYAFNAPFVWAWPVNEQLFGVLALFSGAYALLHGRHIRVEILYERFSSRMKVASSLITAVCILAFIGGLVWEGYLMAAMSFKGREAMTGIIYFPLYPLKLLIPVAAFLFLFQGIAYFVREVRRKQAPMTE